MTIYFFLFQSNEQKVRNNYFSNLANECIFIINAVLFTILKAFISIYYKGNKNNIPSRMNEKLFYFILLSLI